MDSEVIQTLGKYEIIAELGRGGMGVVYKARDPIIGRLVALKTMTSELLSNSDSLKRFYREAQAAGSLQHPNLVTIFDLGEASGQPYIAMEFVEGESLREIIAERPPMPLPHRLKIIKQFCSGLGYAHQHGLVHSDVKPANILIRKDGTAKVVDFGIVHVESTSMTKTGMFVGTVQYASPEQLNDGDVDQRSDIFSVGVVIYEFLTYQRPFDAPILASVINQILNKDPVPVAELVVGIPPELDLVVRRCLEKDPANRFPSIHELLLELDPLASTLQHNLAQELVSEVPDLIAHRDLTRARDVLRDALMLESNHPLAKSLMNEVNSEIRRLEVSAKIRAHVAEGQGSLERRDYEGAVRSFEEAAKLDSGHEEAQALLAGAREKLAQANQIRQSLTAARNAYRSGDLTQAELSLKEVLELDKTNSDAQAILAQIRQERAERERRFQLREAVWEVRGLLERAHYQDAARRLAELQQEFPNEAEVGKLAAETRQKAEALRGEIRGVKALLETGRFQEAVERAGSLSARFPQRPEVTDLYESTKKQSELVERRRALTVNLTRIQRLIDSGDYAKAFEECEITREHFPESVELERLTVLAHSQKLAQEVERQVETACQRIQALLDAGRYDEAAAQAERELARLPGSPQLVRLLVSAQRSQFEAARQSMTYTPRPSSRFEEAIHQSESAPERLGEQSGIEKAPEAAFEAQLGQGEPEAYSATQIFLPQGASPLPPAGGFVQPSEKTYSPVEGVEWSEPGRSSSEQENRGSEAEHLPSAASAWLKPRILLVLTAALAVIAVGIAGLWIFRTRHAPPPPPALVALTIPTSPEGATVTIDGQGSSSNPAQFNLKPGSYKLEARKQGYTDFSEKLNVTQGMNPAQMLTLTALPLKLRVNASDLKKVSVKWDDEPPELVTRGEWSRDVAVSSQTQTHRLEISVRGARTQLTVEVTAGASPSIALRPNAQNLDVVAMSSFGGQAHAQFTSAHTKVSIDGQRYDLTSPTSAANNLTSGIHKLAWESGAGSVTKEFETGSNPGAAIFLIRPAAQLSWVRPVTPEPQAPVQSQADKELQQKIADLTSKAANAAKAGNLAEPEGDNAIFYADQLLQLDSKNSYAPGLRDWSVHREKTGIQSALATKNFVAAHRMIDALAKLLPGDPDLPSLQKQLAEAEAPPKLPAPPPPPTSFFVRYNRSHLGRSFVPGRRAVSGRTLQFQEYGPNARSADNFRASCSEIVDVRAVKGLSLHDAYYGPSSFHIWLRSKHYEFDALASNGEVLGPAERDKILAAVLSACPSR